MYGAVDIPSRLFAVQIILDFLWIGETCPMQVALPYKSLLADKYWDLG